MPGPILILSDTHLGRPGGARSAAALRPLWRNAAHLVINGDVCDIHHPEYRGPAAREMVRLMEFCEEDGVALTPLSGNHDPYLTDLRHLRLADGRVFVTHGDVLHPAIAPWSPSAGRLRDAHDEALAAIRPYTADDLDARLDAAQHASYQEWEQMEKESSRSGVMGMLLRPWKIIEVLLYWRKFPHLAADFLREHAPDARFIIIGHTHRPGVWEIDGRTVINTGAFGFPGTPRAVTLENRTLSYWSIENGEDAYRLAEEPERVFTLRAAPANA